MGNLRSWIIGPKNFALRHKKLTVLFLIILASILYFIFIPRSTANILTQKVVRQDVVTSVSVTGNVYAGKQVNLTFQIPGKLSFLGVKQGDSVKAYQTIATLDESTAQKNLEQALIAYDLQRRTFDVTQTDNQNRTPEQALSESMKTILLDNQYNLQTAVNSVELADLAKQLSVLTTPISGIVTRCDAVTAGVNVTTTTTFTVTDPNSLEFQIEVDEADIGSIKVGQEADISLDAFPDNTLHLRVDRIDFVSHVSSSGGNAFYVYANMPSSGNYRVGMSGNADIITDIKKNVLTVPLSSIMDDNTVYVKNSQGYFVKTGVQTGIQSDTLAQVISGLSEGQTVAIDPSSVPQKDIRSK